MARPNLTAERLCELLRYDPETGEFTWLTNRGPNAKAGNPAGSVYRGKTGYRCLVIRLEREIYQAHRLAWFYVYGEWPRHEVDHIDGDALNNRIVNLRDVEHGRNMENARKPMPFNDSGLLGVCFDKDRKKWRATISIGNKAKHLGRFTTAEEANAAYLAAKRRLHEGCTV